MESNCNINFEFNPLGDLIVKWEIPIAFLEEGSKYLIEIPGYKYDLPKFLSIPVPFSSKSIEIKTEILSVSEGIEVKEIPAKYGNLNIEIEAKNLSTISSTKVNFEYKIYNILNADGVYFVAVYPFRTPFDNQKHNLNICCKFSYNIRKYKFWERYFEYPSNKKLNNIGLLKYSKIGDEFNINGSIIGNRQHTIDLHITGTRFPILIRRDYFWLLVYLISALVFLSPFLSEFKDLLYTKSECGELTNYNFTIFNF